MYICGRVKVIKSNLANKRKQRNRGKKIAVLIRSWILGCFKQREAFGALVKEKIQWKSWKVAVGDIRGHRPPTHNTPKDTVYSLRQYLKIHYKRMLLAWEHSNGVISNSDRRISFNFPWPRTIYLIQIIKHFVVSILP